MVPVEMVSTYLIRILYLFQMLDRSESGFEMSQALNFVLCDAGKIGTESSGWMDYVRGHCGHWTVYIHATTSNVFDLACLILSSVLALCLARRRCGLSIYLSIYEGIPMMYV